MATAHSPRTTPLKGERFPFPEAEDVVVRAIWDPRDRLHRARLERAGAGTAGAGQTHHARLDKLPER